MAVVEGKNVLYTAHHGKTVRKMFKAILDIFERNPELKELLLPGARGVYRAAGSEGIYVADGGLIEFATRTNGGGRGETYDVIIVDEAQELTEQQAEALKPTTLASESGDPQMIYLGTPPNEKCPGTVFRDLHRKAHAGEAGGVWWVEWGAQEIGDPHDVDRWYECCPAMGYRIKEDVMADAADTISPEGFAREYLGWWSNDCTIERVIDEETWNACKTNNPPKEGGIVCYAIKFTTDGKAAAVVACRKPTEGLPHIEVVDFRSSARGVTWFRNFIVDRKLVGAEFVIDGKSKSSVLERRLIEAKMPKKAFHVAKTAEVISGCQMLEDAVAEGRITHFGQQGLDSAATLCGRRRIGDGGGWGFESTGNAEAALIEAAALAYQSAMTTKRDPNRKLRVG